VIAAVVAIGCMFGRPAIDQIAGSAPKVLPLQILAVVNDSVCDLGRLIVLHIPPKPSDLAAGLQNALQLAIDLRAAAFAINAGPTPVGGKSRGGNPGERQK